MILKIRQPSDKSKVLDYISKLPDKSYDITVNIHRQIRSVPQNKLYWLWVNAISSETGNEPEDLHKYFGEKWLPIQEVQTFNHQQILKATSTTKLNTAEFTDYLNKIQTFASTELGIVLPVPEDLIFDQFMDYYSNRF